MAAFATAEDVATQMQINLSAEDTATVVWLLDGASDMIRDYTRQYIEAVDGRVENLRASNGVWMVKELPIRAIDSITVDAVAFTDYDYDPAAGIISRLDGTWMADDPVAITYDSGYSIIPFSIRSVCVDVVKRAFENPAGLQRDDLNTASQWLGLTKENKAILDRYRITR